MTISPPNCRTKSAKSCPVGKLSWGWLMLAGVLLYFCWGNYQSPDTIDLPIAKTIELRNLHQVHTYLWRGGFPSFAGLKQLKDLGFTTVIDLRSAADSIKLETMECQVLGLQYISLPTSNYQVPNARAQNIFIQTVQKARDSQGKQRVFVHCSAGCDRTGYIVGLWRLTQDKFSPAATVYEMLKYGFLFHQIRLPGH